MEDELKGARPSLERDAKVNLLKYLQVQTVNAYEAAYDGLFFDLNKDGGLECVRGIDPVSPKGPILQPKVLDLQGYEGAARLAKQLDVYLADAHRAKLGLDAIIKAVVEGSGGCEAQYAPVKARESTERKANTFFGGDVRRLADMARVAVICDTPEHFEQVYRGIMKHLQVKRGISHAEWIELTAKPCVPVQ